jgi:beta-glucanase (GH16 family)
MKKLIATAIASLSLIVASNVSSLAAPKKVVQQKTPATKVISVTKPMTSEYWNLSEGFDFSGNLKQVYVEENVGYDNKTILLKAFNETTANPMYATGIDDERVYTKTAPYSGGKLILKEKFLYGRITFSAKFPNSPGTLPCMWLFDEVKSGANKHYTELDLLEIPGSEKGNMYSGAHWGIDYQSLKKDFSKRFVPNVATAYHKYEIVKTSSNVSVYVDGKLIKSISTANKTLSNGVNGFKQPLNLIINMNVGDKWGGAVDDTKFPHKFVIKDLVIEKYNN